MFLQENSALSEAAVPKPEEPFMRDYYDKDGKAATWMWTRKVFYGAFAYDKYSVSDRHA